MRFVVICSVMLLVACSGPLKTRTPRFDGIYRSQSGTTKYGPVFDYLRFYPDGSVVSSALIGTPEQFWVSTFKDLQYQSKGRYKLKDNRLSFVTLSPDAEVRYAGYMLSDITLELQIDSRATDYSAGRYYVFMKVDVQKLPGWVRLRTVKLMNDGKIKLQDVPVNGIQP